MSKEVMVAPRVKGRMSLQEYERKLLAKRQTLSGAEMPDKRPMEPPIGYVKQPSMFDRMRSMIAAEFARREDAREFGEEYYGDDEEDFNIEDDPFPASGKEYTEADQKFIEETVRAHNKKLADDKAAAEIVKKDAAEPRPPEPVPGA